MTHNDILRRLRHILSASDEEMVQIFALSGETLNPERVRAIMKREEEPGAIECTARQLEAFLDGLILDRRGPHDGPARPKSELTNNEILKKLRIAFSLRNEEVLAMLEAGGHTGPDGKPMGKTELSALFRAPTHRHFRPCGNQVLRKFLLGLTRAKQGSAD